MLLAGISALSSVAIPVRKLLNKWAISNSSVASILLYKLALLVFLFWLEGCTLSIIEQVFPDIVLETDEFTFIILSFRTANSADYFIF